MGPFRNSNQDNSNQDIHPFGTQLEWANGDTLSLGVLRLSVYRYHAQPLAPGPSEQDTHPFGGPAFGSPRFRNFFLLLS